MFASKYLRRTRLFIGLFLSCIGFTVSFHAHAKALKIGVLAWNASMPANSEWAALNNVIERHTLTREFEIYPMTNREMADALEKNQLDFVLTNPGYYLQHANKFQLSRVATLITAPASLPTEVLASAIIVRNDVNNINTLEDIKNKSVAVVSTKAFGGFLLVAHRFKQAGHNIHEWFSHIDQTGLPHDRIMQAVAEGKADVGIIRACLLERLQAKGDPNALRLKIVLRQPSRSLPCAISSDLYPGWALGVAKHVDPVITHHLTLALLSTPPLQDGSYWTIPVDYSNVLDLLETLNHSPYQDAEDSLKTLTTNYQAWFFALAGLLMAWIIYTWKLRSCATRNAEMRDTLTQACTQKQHEIEYLAHLGMQGELLNALPNKLLPTLNSLNQHTHTLRHLVEHAHFDPTTMQQITHEMTQDTNRANEVIQKFQQLVTKRSVKRVTEDINEVIRQSAEWFRTLHTDQPEIRLNLPQQPVPVQLDAQAIQQVLLTLLKNILETQDAPSYTTIDMYVEPRENAVMIGLCTDIARRAQSRQDQLNAALEFGAFYLKPEWSPCKSMVEAHGGTIEWHPLIGGHGVTIELTLPYYRHQTAESAH